ncbi:unnamed protein product [Meganyctiphanes norvegica]|uniref:Protein CDV3 homolog n=1 Tax=Meganyctiphanes norvegica TaxID=48144 RepID=A0AAV2RNF2_MEGNR
MADLDSFFAKKDKKKVKGKKFTTTDEIAKRLEDCEEKLKVKPKIIEPPKKQEGVETIEEQEAEANKSTIGKGDSGNVKKEEEEWNDFVDESDRDLTDLKITKLNIEDDEDGNQGNTEDDNEKGEEGTRKGGVWQTSQQTTNSAPVEEIVAPTVVEEKKPAAEEKKGGYVPPHLRNMVASPLPRGNAPQRRNRAAPDINNEMAFPSLSDAGSANPMGAWGRRQNTQGFESVKQGASARSSYDAHDQPKLSTANRFDCLTDNS